MGFLKVTMQGFIGNVESRMTQNGKKLVKGKFVIPMEAYNGDVYDKTVNITAWEDMGDIVEQIPKDMEITVTGSLRTSSYDGKCPHCSEPVKNYWTEIVIDNIDLGD